MAADIEQPQRYEQVFAWVCCVNCGTRLWKRFPDHFEMTFIRRGGRSAPRDETGAVRKRTINVSPEAASGVEVVCEKCGRENVPAVELSDG